MWGNEIKVAYLGFPTTKVEQNIVFIFLSFLGQRRLSSNLFGCPVVSDFFQGPRINIRQVAQLQLSFERYSVVSLVSTSASQSTSVSSCYIIPTNATLASLAIPSSIPPLYRSATSISA